MTCCDDGDSKQEGLVKDRKCRDLLFALLFFVFWIGMFLVGAYAYKNGDYNRLVYSYDSYGFTCGSINTFGNVTIDLRAQTNKYYLNAFDLLDIANFDYARSVCVAGCPTTAQICALNQMPCKNASQFICPYYGLAETSVHGQLGNLSRNNVSYFDALPNIAAVPYGNISLFVEAIQVLGPYWRHVLTTLGLPSTPTAHAPAAVSGSVYQLTSTFPSHGPCYPILTTTEPIFHRCFPEIPLAWVDDVEQELNSTVGKLIGADRVHAFSSEWNSLSQRFNRYIADISRGVLIIVVAGLISSLILSLVWICIMRWFTALVVWLTIALVNAALLGCTLFCFAMAQSFGDNSWAHKVYAYLPDDPFSTTRRVWLILGICNAILFAFIFIITLLMIRRVRIAIACIKVASQAIGKMPLIMLFPLFPFVWVCILMLYWFAVLAMLWSSGSLTPVCRTDTVKSFDFKNMSISVTLDSVFDPAPSGCYLGVPYQEMVQLCAEDDNCYIALKWNRTYQGMFVYHLFGLLWTFQFIMGYTYVTIAGAVGEYYWWAGGLTNEFSAFPVASSAGRALWYHNGSIAFGSFIMALLWLIRLLLEYLVNSLNEAKTGNCCCALEWICCCCMSCLSCLQWFVAFLNRNAYIIIGIKGSNYCAAAGRAIALIVGNVLRIAVVNVVGSIMMFLGKVVVAATCGIIAFATSTADYYTDAQNHPNTYLSSCVMPVALSVLVAYVVADLFFAVFEGAIDTIILAFCEDCDNGGGEPKHAPPLLMEAMGQRVVTHEAVHGGPAASSNKVTPMAGQKSAAPGDGAPLDPAAPPPPQSMEAPQQNHSMPPAPAQAYVPPQVQPSPPPPPPLPGSSSLWAPPAGHPTQGAVPAAPMAPPAAMAPPSRGGGLWAPPSGHPTT